MGYIEGFFGLYSGTTIELKNQRARALAASKATKESKRRKKKRPAR